MVVTTKKRREFRAYGEVARIFDWLDHPEQAPMEVLCEGVAGSGKSRQIAEWIYAVCKRWPQSKGLVVRETRVSLNDSFLDIWENEVLGPEHPAVLDGPSREGRHKYEHPSLGGTVMLGGMDNPTRLFSTQYDWIYFNEAQETTQTKWESLHRALRRRGTGFNVLLGDCNPEGEDHFLNLRCNEGRCMRLKARFWDNPQWYDHTARKWTEEGEKYLARLSLNLTGVRRKRLFEGKWVAATGQVWGDWDPHVHVRVGELVRDSGRAVLRVQDWPGDIWIRWFFGAQDMGFNAPGCFQLWGVDGEGRMWRVKEIYRRGWMHKEWAEAIHKINEEWPMAAIVTDHDPAYQKHLQAEFHDRGLSSLVQSWDKTRQGSAEKAGIEEVRSRLTLRSDGTRGVYFLRDANIHIDRELRADGLPWCTEREIPSYVYPEQADGKPIKDEPDPTNKWDHGCDALRGAAMYARGRDHSREEVVKLRSGSLGSVLGIKNWARVANG